VIFTEVHAVSVALMLSESALARTRAGLALPVVVLPDPGLSAPVCVHVPEYVIVPELVRVLVPTVVVGVDPSGQVVEAAMVTLPLALIVNLLNVDRVSVIVAAAVMLIVPLECVKVVAAPDCVQDPASAHVPLVAMMVLVPLKVTAPVLVAAVPPFQVPPVTASVPAPEFSVNAWAPLLSQVPAAMLKLPVQTSAVVTVIVPE